MASVEGAGDLRRDARDIRRGVAVNFVGYAIKLAHPLLLIAVIRLYGAEVFGLFAYAQAAILLLLRVGLLGLDKAILWWLPREEPGKEAVVMTSAITVAATVSVATAAMVFVLTEPFILRAVGLEQDLSLPIRMMAVALAPAAITELLTHATMGRRKMGTQVFIKEGLGAVSLVVMALVMAPWAPEHVALPLAFVLSQCLTLVAAWIAFTRLFGRHPLSGARGRSGSFLAPLRPLFRYALPMWVAEFGNSLLLRLDTLLVGYFVDDMALVGVYAVVVRIGEQMRAIRRAFDPIVLAIASEVDALKDNRRLDAAFAYATSLITSTQTPIFAFLLLFAPWVMELFGEGFGVGVAPLVVLCGFWIINGVLGLAGVVVTATGRSQFVLLNTFIALIVELGVGILLIPRFSLIGATLAVGIAYTMQSLAAVMQMRMLNCGVALRSFVGKPFILSLVAFAISGVAWWLTSGLAEPGVAPSWVRNVVVFAIFMVVYGLGMLRLLQQRRREAAPSP